MNDIRMIALDLDGTLVQTDGSILPETLDVLREVSSRGIVVALASGRYPENAGLTLLDNGLSGPVMGANGAIIQDKPLGQTLFLHMIKDETARAACECLDRMGSRYIIFSYKTVTTSHVGMTHRSEINDGARIAKLGGISFNHGPEAVKAALSAGISKVFIPDQPNRKEIGEAMRAIPHLQVTRSNASNVELMPEGIHKGRGITELSRRLGIPLSSVMAFGDEENDLSILTLVGYGVAMGNAPDHVKARCKYTTDSFDNGGVGKAIERFVLNRRLQ